MKKTGIEKVMGRKPYTIVYMINKLKQSPFKEQIVVRDFTSNSLRYG